MIKLLCIKQLLGIKDKNIILEETPITYEKKKGVNRIVVHTILTDEPVCCKMCGLKNESHYDLIKYGTKVSSIKLKHINLQPIFEIKKTFYCKYCAATFIAKINLVNHHCFLSNTIKMTITMELRETQFTTFIGKHISIPSHTVIRVLTEVEESIKISHTYLPQHLSINEF